MFQAGSMRIHAWSVQDPCKIHAVSMDLRCGIYGFSLRNPCRIHDAGSVQGLCIFDAWSICFHQGIYVLSMQDLSFSMSGSMYCPRSNWQNLCMFHSGSVYLTCRIYKCFRRALWESMRDLCRIHARSTQYLRICDAGSMVFRYEIHAGSMMQDPCRIYVFSTHDLSVSIKGSMYCPCRI